MQPKVDSGAPGLIVGSLRTNDGHCNGNAIRGHGVPVPGLDERALRGNWRERQLQNGGKLKRGLVNEVELEGRLA